MFPFDLMNLLLCRRLLKNFYIGKFITFLKLPLGFESSLERFPCTQLLKEFIPYLLLVLEKFYFLMCRSLIHLTFILVYGVRYGSNCIFFFF